MGHRLKHRIGAQTRAALRVIPEHANEANRELDAFIDPWGQPTPKQSKPALQRRASHATRPHHLRGRHPSPETVAWRRRANQIAKRSRKINRPRQKRRGQIVALAWLLLASIIIGGALGLSPRANALTYGAPLHVTASWIGGSCWGRIAFKPADRDARILTSAVGLACIDTAVDFQFVTPGQWYGIDPEIGDAFAVSCTVTNSATGVIVLTDFATKGNGHNATCLGKWI